MAPKNSDGAAMVVALERAESTLYGPNKTRCNMDKKSIRRAAGKASRVDQARTNVINAALELYKNLGVRNVTMQDIAIQAKVTRPTVYRYFPSCKQLLHGVVAHRLLALWNCVAVNHQNKDAADCADYFAVALMYIIQESRQLEEYQILFAAEAGSAVQETLLFDVDHRAKVKEILDDACKNLQTAQALDLNLIAELMCRLIASYLKHPKPIFGTTESQLRLLTASMLAPH